MENKELIKEISYKYVKFMYNDYNVQILANKNYLLDKKKEEILKKLDLGVEKFCSEYESFVTRDFVYKNDFFTPRNMYLIHPLFYLYYTYLVFLIADDYFNNENINFSNERMNIYHSGKLILRDSDKDIKFNSKYKNSYQDYQKKRESYSEQPVINIDLKDFFNAINIDILIEKLLARGINDDLIKSLKYFFEFCNFKSLPQIHYSIASSILSQFYLLDFDEKVYKLLETENMHLIRYVDDMTFVHLNGFNDYKKNNRILNYISSYLWTDFLVLNSSKTKILSAEEYKKSIELATDDYEITIPRIYHQYKSEKLIEEKAVEVIKSRSLVELIEELCELKKQKGVDLVEYNKYMMKRLSINGGEVNKVLSNIIFSGKWMGLNDNDLLILIRNFEYILFNPTQFTILYIKVYRHLEKRKKIDSSGKGIKEIFSYLLNLNELTIRDILIAVSYLFQNKSKNKKIVDKIKISNPQYIRYFDEFINNY